MNRPGYVVAATIIVRSSGVMAKPLANGIPAAIRVASTPFSSLLDGSNWTWLTQPSGRPNTVSS